MKTFSQLGKTLSVFSLGMFCGAAYLISCGQTNTAVSSGGAINATAITAETLLTTGTITSGGAITAPSIKLTTGAGDGKFLTSNSSGDASWGTPFRTSCPAGYTLIGTAGTPDAFCITTSYEKPGGFAGRNWATAYDNCAAKTPSASLCTIIQWQKACKLSNDLEDENQGSWLLDASPYWNEDTNRLSYNGAWIASGSNCGIQEVISKENTGFYRCCFR